MTADCVVRRVAHALRVHRFWSDTSESIEYTVKMMSLVLIDGDLGEEKVDGTWEYLVVF